ncbi:MAG: DNA-processing protein DprA [Eubacteriales bacterium]|nr:DNA-processing protein DprA [Eubacteriales bacterium]
MKKTYGYRIMLAIIIIIQVVYISCMFGINKQGFHSDEMWNYGFANSTEGKHVYESDVEKQLKNFDSWQSSDNLRNYITVDKNEIFNYAAIYRNAANDYNPPLGYMMLHFICSLFPGTWSKWYCFALNIICFVIMQIYIYRLAKSVTKSEAAGLLSAFFFGFTAGARNITIFLRIYAPATMFAAMLVYYMHVLYASKDNKDKCIGLYIKIFAVNILGCFTLNLFLPFAFIVTAMYCVYYILARRFRRLLVFGLMMLASVGASIAIYPRTNIELYTHLHDCGGIISEYPPGTAPRAGLFPMRNRIISAMADALVVVEARQKSGSLITADQALEQNRDVYVVPGRIGDALSEGCLKLIKEGAQVITSPMDIMATKSIEIYYNNRQMTDNKLDSLDSNSIFDDNFKKSGLASPKNMVYSQINLFPVSLETIVNNSGLSLVEAEGILLELELDGLIEEVSKNYYIRKHI